ncbi:MAG TPA: pyridoxal-phosphate dependent enzyme [Myxococcota bacterium]|nr:pyridoxal-phosphate dependent enzyme [Myxococcota bacterium]HRY96681.1 pyridoxal-phosphate dependent enzyme [Myxococcota bacterium]HSA20581.1 pyridoxal-phosphate dependent enzyme [Myxococcota bacterium]
MGAWNRPLAALYPSLATALGPLELASLPTPVQALTRLGLPGLYVKRDDLSSALYGGNKVRKLEFLLGAARASGARTVLTMGGAGSNHLLATALHGLGLGLRTAGVIFPQPDSPAVRRQRCAYRGAGVELLPTPSKYLLPASVLAALVRLRLREGRFPALVPGGGSSPLGCLGFVNAGLELAEQVRARALPEPAAVFVPYGTGGTAVGLALGLRLGELGTRVVAVRVIDRLVANRPRLELLAWSLGRLIRRHAPGARLPRELLGNLEIRQGQLGAGYGHPTPQGEAAQAAFSEAGLRLELTYTAKAAAAFLEEARRGAGPLLFWLTYSSADIDRWVTGGGGDA